MKKCETCGFVTDEEIRFCPECGNQMVTVSENAYCPHCGAKIRSEDRFCPACGANTKGNDSANKGNTILGGVLQGIDPNSKAFQINIKKYLFYGLEWIVFLVSALLVFTGSLFAPSEGLTVLTNYIDNTGSISGMMKVKLFDLLKIVFAVGKLEGWDQMNSKYYICLVSLAVICFALVITAIIHTVFLVKRAKQPYGYVEILNSGYYYHIAVLILLGLLWLFRQFGGEDLSTYIIFSSNFILLILLSATSLAIVLPMYKKAAYLAKEYNE